MGDAAYQDLYERALRAIAGRKFGDVVERTRAIVGPSLKDIEGAAHAGLAALKKAERPTAEQVKALQAVVRAMRPSVLSRRSSVAPLPPETVPVFPDWPAFVQGIIPHLYTIGRVDRVGRHALPSEPFGTGFLIAPDLLLTNHHVITQLTNGTDVINADEVEVYFVAEDDVPEEEPAVPVLSIHAFHAEHDAVILRLAADERLQNRAPLRWSSDPLSAGDQVVVLGYPSQDRQRNPLFESVIFGDRLNIKRLAPGELVGRRDGAVYHDCSTLGGNSGSPVVDLKSGTVVGLHREGYFLARNEAVSAEALHDFVRG